MIAPPLDRRLRVLLVNPGPEPAPGDRYAPMGLMALAATARLEHDVRIRDWTYERWSDQELVDSIVKGGYDIIGFTSMTWQIIRTYELVAQIKQACPDLPIILGGIHGSSVPQEVFDNGNIDYICNGEGEETFTEFLRVYFSGGDVKEVAGLWLRDDEGKAFSTATRPLVDLTTLPPPARDLVPIPEHLEDGSPNPAFSDLGGVMFSRGCSANCDFCASPTFWRRKVRLRTVDQMIDEVVSIQETYGLTAFAILDDVFTINKKVMIEFCERVASMRLTFTCLARVDQMDEEKLLALRKAGCTLMSYGVESGNQDILDGAQKHQNLDRVKQIFALHHKLKVPVCALLIIGHPHESEKELQDTYDLLVEIKPTYCLPQFMCPYPGTAMYHANIAVDTGTVLSWDWSTYAHQDPVYVPKSLTAEKMLAWREKIHSLNPADPAKALDEWTSTYLWQKAEVVREAEAARAAQPKS